MNGNTSKFGVSGDDIRAYDWQAVIAAVPERECHCYFAPLFRKRDDLEKVGDDRGARVYSFLGFLATLAQFDQPGENSYGERANTLVEEDFSAMRQILPEIQDPEFRALVADILWELKKDHKAAKEVLIPALLESAAALEEPDMWPPFVGRLESALRLIEKFKLKEQRDSLFQKLEDIISRYEPDPTAGLLCARLMGFLLIGKSGNAEYYAQLSEKLAVLNCDLKRWDFSHEYWSLSAAWHGLAGKLDARRNALIQAAEVHVLKAEANMAEDKPKFGIAFSAHWIGAAVEALRQAKAPERAADLHKRFLELQVLSMSEMKTFTIDSERIPGLQESQEKAIAETQKWMSGLSLCDAIFRLAFIVDPTHVAELQEEIEKQAAQSPFSSLFGSQAVSSKGKVTDYAAPIASEDEELRAEAIRKQMFQQSRTIGWPLRVHLHIEPALDQFLGEHAITIRDLSTYVTNHPFIPQGHERIFARGLHSGFRRDWLVALHLLIPQLENGVRLMFEKNGEIVSGFDSDGIQKEKDLGWLLTHKKMVEIFGADLAFDLRGLLVERFGHNYRNEMAHGLLPEGAFYTESAVYVWWLALRLICIPLVSKS